MELVNEFTVNRPIDEAWAVLTDVERIAPCLPGAQLQEIEGDVFRGVVKVKVGPISAALKGEASFVERDDTNHRAVLKGDGRDTKGNGNASALITATLEQLDATSAKCIVHTDLNMTGKVAQFGRGALADISGKLMQQFARNLDEMLAKDATVGNGSGTADAASGSASTVSSDVNSGADPAPVANAELKAEPSASDSASSGKRVINGPAAEPIDAFSLGGSAVLKRLLPLFGGLVILLLALRRRKK
jgi:carbon monoxide dehydrogenase subunit G